MTITTYTPRVRESVVNGLYDMLCNEDSQGSCIRLTNKATVEKGKKVVLLDMYGGHG